MTQLFVTWVRRPVRTLDRGTLRSAGFVCLLVVVFLAVNTSVAHAATDDPDSAGLLAPLNIYSSEGVPLDGYELNANGGSIVSFKSQALTFVLGGLFTIIRILVGLACWAVEFAFRFPLLRMLSDPAQEVSDAYEHAVVDTLGLKALLLGWAFVFGLVMFIRGKVGKGLGEIVLTLLIAAFAASAFVRPDYLLSSEGPLVQTQQAASEVAQMTVSSYTWGNKITSDPCADMAGPSEAKCQEREAKKQVTAAEVARPIQDSVTNALVVKPYMLLQYGRILDPGKASDRKAYAVHLKLISGGYQPGGHIDEDVDPKRKDACSGIIGLAHQYCIDGDAGAPSNARDDSDVPPLTAPDALLGTLTPVLTEEDQQFAAALADLQKAGPVGKACAEYAQKPTWSRAGGAVLLLIAALMICAMLLSAAIVLLGAQATNIAAAAAGVVAFVLGMLPGPSRQSVWKWLSLFAVSMLSTFAVSMFLPAFGIAVDAILTNGPDLMIERILLLDVLAVGGLAFQRRLVNGITVLGHRMARAKSSQPGGPQALAKDAMAEARRGLAPLSLGVQASRLALRGAHGVLIGRRPPPPPKEDESVKLLRIIAHGNSAAAGDEVNTDGAGSDGTTSVNKQTAQAHAPESGRPLLGYRIHQRASRFRGYRFASRAARIGYGATLGLPRTLKTRRGRATQHTQDARAQLKVVANRVREDAGEWASAGRSAAATGRAVGARVDDASQRLATAWQVHNPPAAVRNATRNAAASAVILASPSARRTVPPTGAGVGNDSATRNEDPPTASRRRLFEARMQRSTWNNRQSQGGDSG